MNERKTIQRLMRATRGLAYWSSELLKVDAAIQRQVADGRTDTKGRTTARKDKRDAS